ncbi:MAG: UDP-N-acetylglucosamine 2-epimerase (hydrolyzing) [Crocinitomicaceae bacterium]|nr:UDP-N-acetylglucosamine 2-epimerase (hydrolyzing) [Crocinitomicaceae bacterium]|tara:strand:- start:11452 stop:12612 length:1161 start_codon:yes stop_codon:yes gene_type:complete
MRKICVITGTRAEYGLLYWVMKSIHQDKELQLQIIVTGMHLSTEFGLTYERIEKNGFYIDKKIEILLSSDTPIGISKSMGLAMISFSEAFEELQPDLVLVLGDRFEIFSAVSSAMIGRIPVAHCHGGEATEGLIDESIRHCITKMSHIHFCSTEDYKRRIIQLGEKPKSIYNVGALGIENINKMKLLSRKDFEDSISFKLDKKYSFLVTFHPVTLEKSTAGEQIDQLLEALDNIDGCNIIFTKPNSDTDGRIINKRIDEYVKNNPNKSVCFTSLGQLRYLSALKYVDCVIGNSSSGLIEVPSFKTATVNIGDRQRGRIFGDSVISCSSNTEDIEKAIKKSISSDFKECVLSGAKNPYGKGNSSDVIVEVLKKTKLKDILKKQFHDL